jgi:hypothetical protein
VKKEDHTITLSVSLYSVPCLGDLSLLRRAVEQRAVVAVTAAAHDQAPDARVGKNPVFLVFFTQKREFLGFSSFKNTFSLGASRL